MRGSRFELLYVCWLSGRVSERQWEAHQEAAPLFAA